jgi:hypothetical protein
MAQLSNGKQMARKHYSTVLSIIFTVGLFCSSISSLAQHVRVKAIDKLEQNQTANRLILLRKEPVYTYVPGGKAFKADQYFYFSKMNRSLSLVAIYESEAYKRKGIQMFYLFQGNSLVKVRIIPPSYMCSRCKAEYYFDDDELIHKNMEGITEAAAKELRVMANALLAKMPRELACGYFEWE